MRPRRGVCTVAQQIPWRFQTVVDLLKMWWMEKVPMNSRVLIIASSVADPPWNLTLKCSLLYFLLLFWCASFNLYKSVTTCTSVNNACILRTTTMSGFKFSCMRVIKGSKWTMDLMLLRFLETYGATESCLAILRACVLKYCWTMSSRVSGSIQPALYLRSFSGWTLDNLDLVVTSWNESS